MAQLDMPNALCVSVHRPRLPAAVGLRQHASTRPTVLHTCSLIFTPASLGSVWDLMVKPSAATSSRACAQLYQSQALNPKP